MIAGEKAKITADVMLDNGKEHIFDPAGEDSLVLESVSPTLLSLDTDGNAKALAAGTAQLRATAKIGGEQIVAYYAISIESGKLIDFRTGDPAQPKEANYDKHGWCINYDASTPGMTDRANFGMSSLGFNSEYQQQNDVLALDFSIDNDSVYDMDVTYFQIGEYGAQLGLYVDDRYVGTIDCSHPTDTSDTLHYDLLAKCNSVALERGRHVLKIKRLNGGSYRHAYGYLESILLRSTKGAEFDCLEIALPAEQLELGSTMRATIRALRTSGRAYQFGPMIDGMTDANNNLQFESTNPAAATIAANGVITPIRAGETTIRAVAMIDGVRHEQTTALTVIPKIRRLYVRLPSEQSPLYDRIRLILTMFPGSDRLVFYFEDAKKRRSAACVIHPALVDELNTLLGAENVVVREEIQKEKGMQP